MKYEMNDDEVKRQGLRTQAQMNEYIHLIMKKNKIAIRMDENIGVAFFNWEHVSGGRDEEAHHLLEGHSTDSVT